MLVKRTAEGLLGAVMGALLALVVQAVLAETIDRELTLAIAAGCGVLGFVAGGPFLQLLADMWSAAWQSQIH